MLGHRELQREPAAGDLEVAHLCYQIEHHLFPDLPSNRLRRGDACGCSELCEVRPAVQHGFAWPRQYFRTQRTIHGLAFPDWVVRRFGE